MGASHPLHLFLPGPLGLPHEAPQGLCGAGGGSLKGEGQHFWGAADQRQPLAGSALICIAQLPCRLGGSGIAGGVTRKLLGFASLLSCRPLALRLLPQQPGGALSGVLRGGSKMVEDPVGLGAVTSLVCW